MRNLIYGLLMVINSVSLAYMIGITMTYLYRSSFPQKRSRTILNTFAFQTTADISIHPT